jgi:hypothetical protein
LDSARSFEIRKEDCFLDSLDDGGVVEREVELAVDPHAQGTLTKEIMPDLLHPGLEGYRR